MNRLAAGWLKGWALAGVLLLGALAVAWAGDDVGDQTVTGVPAPHIVKPRGDKCVADPAWMRRNHMKLLIHHRVGAVHHGDNQLADRISIINCVNCHASAKDNSVTGPGDFCQSCHAYAAVKITCFECHSSKPSTQAVSPFHPGLAHGAAARMYRAATADAGAAGGMAAHMNNRDLAMAGVVR